MTESTKYNRILSREVYIINGKFSSNSPSKLITNIPVEIEGCDPQVHCYR